MINRFVLTAALMLHGGLALAATAPPTVNLGYITSPNLQQIFAYGFDTTNGVPRAIAVDPTGEIFCNNCAGNGGAVTQGAGSSANAWYMQALSGTFVDGSIATLGTQADAAYAGSGSTSAISALKGIYSALVAPVPAGSNAIGTVGITTLPAIPTGTNVIGSAKLVDAGGTNTATVKAASTAAVATDPAMVVTLSPNNSLPLGTNIIGTVKLVDSAGLTNGAIKAASTSAVASDPALVVAISPNNSVGTPQGTAISGLIGPLVQAEALTANPTFTTATVNPLTTTVNGNLRVSLTSGTLTAMQGFTTAAAASNAAIGASGVFESTPPALTTGQAYGLTLDTAAALQVDNEVQKATYKCSAVIVPAATPTDVFRLLGSSTKTVRVRHIWITTVATTAGNMTLQIAKRSTADGAPASTPTVVALDSNSAAGTAACGNYTSNPTTGTLVGYVDTRILMFPLAGAMPNLVPIDFGVNDQAGVMRGSSSEIDVNLAGGTLPSGASLTADVEWTEE